MKSGPSPPSAQWPRSRPSLPKVLGRARARVAGLHRREMGNVAMFPHNCNHRGSEKPQPEPEGKLQSSKQLSVRWRFRCGKKAKHETTSPPVRERWIRAPSLSKVPRSGWPKPTRTWPGSITSLRSWVDRGIVTSGSVEGRSGLGCPDSTVSSTESGGRSLTHAGCHRRISPRACPDKGHQSRCRSREIRTRGVGRRSGQSVDPHGRSHEAAARSVQHVAKVLSLVWVEG